MQRVGAWGRASVVGVGLICLVAACGGEEIPGAASGGETSGTATGGPPDGGPGVEPCPAGHVRGRTGQCMPAGIQGCEALFIDEDGVCRPSMSKCPAGAVPKVDTSCVPVGISACAPELLEDDGLCHPATAKCPEGAFVVPSEGCVPVDGAGCGAGTWGNVIESPGDLHVSAAAPDASAVVTNSAITLNEGLGVAVVGEGTSLIATSNVIEETKPSSVTGEYGKGIEVSDGAYAELERAPRGRQ